MPSSSLRLSRSSGSSSVSAESPAADFIRKIPNLPMFTTSNPSVLRKPFTTLMIRWRGMDLAEACAQIPALSSIAAESMRTILFISVICFDFCFSPRFGGASPKRRTNIENVNRILTIFSSPIAYRYRCDKKHLSQKGWHIGNKGIYLRPVS